ncbi:MAG: HIT family protein [Hyphomonadaceae bacterium]|nr:HIT family protein [Hyphomonadaceae bacterium]
MSLHGAYDPSNIFAKILRGEAPCARVFEDDVALAFMDVFPQVTGHTLVIPKLAARTILDFPPDAFGPFMTRVHTVARAVEKALAPDGVMLMQLNGAPAGQTVFHCHFHILPRSEGEAMKGHGKASMADIGELNTLAARIAAAL